MVDAPPSRNTGRAPGAHRSTSPPPPKRTRRGLLIAIVCVVALGLSGLAVVAAQLKSPDSKSPGASPPSTRPVDAPRTYRAFTPDSWWNTPLPWNAPSDAAATQILDYMRTAPESGNGCLMLAGAGSSPWGNPIYWAKPSDPTYDIQGVGGDRPPEISKVRIPTSAEPAANNDGTMSIYDLDKGYVVALTDASYDADDDNWTASGATVTYLDSNGLNADLPESDEPRNRGTHRGNNGATMTVSYDMVQAGAIRHVLKVALGPEAANSFVFPMDGSDGDYEGNDPGVPPEGLRLRIKPSIDLDSLDLNPQALVIARALQRYGFYIGDSGGTTALKLENTEAEGRGRLWKLTAFDLCGLPFTSSYWDVVQRGWDPNQ